jgi:hypothetical protein
LARCCKVITTCFAGREVRERPELCGDPPGLFDHAQVFPDPESVLELWQLVMEFERSVDPGVACDTIIVNNDTGWTPGNRYLAALDGTKTRGGRIRVISRGNYGSSLGGYNAAYERFADDYDYWTFTEDDILLTGDRYLERCITAFNARPQTGFVAIQGLSRVIALHAHGGVGTTHASVLAHVRRVWGALPHSGVDEPQTWLDHTVWGEVMFTHLIDRLGYRLVTVQAEAPLYTFAYHHMAQMAGRPLTIAQRPLLRRIAGRLAVVTRQLADQIS